MSMGTHVTWCVNWDMLVIWCCRSCRSSQPTCSRFCDELADNAASATMVMHGIALVLRQRSWFWCSAHAAASRWCLSEFHAVVSCTSPAPASIGLHARVIVSSVDSRWCIWPMACAWSLHDRASAITCFSNRTTPSAAHSSHQLLADWLRQQMPLTQLRWQHTVIGSVDHCLELACRGWAAVHSACTAVWCSKKGAMLVTWPSRRTQAAGPRGRLHRRPSTSRNHSGMWPRVVSCRVDATVVMLGQPPPLR